MQLLLKTLFTFLWSDRQQVFKSRAQTACHLWRCGARYADLIERKVNLVLPCLEPRYEADLAVLVAIRAIGKRTGRQLTQAVV
jgi:hypothetical protein